MKQNKRKLLLIGLSLAIIVLDLWTKHWAATSIGPAGKVSIIPGFFSLVYLENTGAAWSMLEGSRWLFVGLTIMVCAVLVYYFAKEKNFWKLLAYAVLFAGAFGNLYDRAFLGYVRDMIKFIIFGYHFPIFNIADMAVCISIIGLIIITWIEEKRGVMYDA